MGIWITEVDYSPLYNAISGRRNAETIRERQRSAVGDAIVGIADAAVQLGNIVYNQARETNLAKLKLDVQNYQQQAEQQQRDIVLNGDYTYEETGEGSEEYSPLTEAARAETGETVPNQKTIKMPESYEAWYKQAQKEIQEKYKAFPELVSWGLDQLYADYAETKSNVLGDITKKNLLDRAAAEDELLTNAIAQSVKDGTPAAYEAALRSMKSLTPEARPAVEAKAREVYENGIIKKDAVSTTQKDGVAEGLKKIQEAVDAKKITEEEAADLRQAVEVAASDANTLYLGKAQTEFTRMKQTGVSDEFALANAGNGTPTAYRAQVDKLLRSAYEEQKRQADWTADAEMLEWHGDNPTDGWGLWKKLHDPTADYNLRMSTSTYTFWERYAQGLMDISGSGSDEDITPPEVLTKLENILKRTDLTPERKREEIRKLSKTETVGFETLRKFLGYTDDKIFDRDVTLNAIDRIHDYFGTPEALKGENPSLAEQQALSEFARQLEERSKQAKGGVLDDETIDMIATSVMKPGKTQTPKADQVPSNARNTEAARMITRALTKKGPLLTATEQASLDEYLGLKLQYHYGVTADDIRISEFRDNGVPSFWVMGLDPQDPEREVKLTYRTDERGNLYPAIMDSRSQWIPLTLETVQDREARLKKEASQAAAAESYRFSAVTETAAGALNKPAVSPATGKPTAPVGGTVATIRSTAKEVGSTPEAIVQQSTGNAGLNIKERGDLLEKLETVKGDTVSGADVERLAKEMGKRIDHIWAALIELGYKVGD